MENNQQLLDQYKSYFDKLQNGFPSKEYAGSKLIATNKSTFCENGSCKFISQETHENKPIELRAVAEVDNTAPDASNSISHSITVKETKDFYDMNNMAGVPHAQLHNTANNFHVIKSWQPTNMQMPANNPYLQNAFKQQQNFQRFNGMNRSFRMPMRNSSTNFKIGNNYFNGLY